MQSIENFKDFWPIYLRAHSDPRCRALHYAASITGIGALVLAVVTMNGWWVLGGAIGAYAFAWAGHLFMEKNVPLTFTHPFWSLMADYRLFGLWATGRLTPHLEQAGVK